MIHEAKLQQLYTVAIAAVVGLGCKQDNVKTDDEAGLDTGDGSVEGRSVLLHITDIQGQSISKAAVTVDGQLDWSDSAGYIRFELDDNDQFVARVDAPGHTSSIVAIDISDDLHAYREVKLWPLSADGVIDAVSGGMVEVDDVRVTIPPNSLRNRFDEPIKGNVEVSIIRVDPTLHELQLLPAPMKGKKGVVEDVLMKSLVLVDVSLSQYGYPLQLAPGASVQVEVVVPPSLAASNEPGAQIPSWSLDLNAGEWIADGEGMLIQVGNDLVWLGEILELGWHSSAHESPDEEFECYVVVARNENDELVSRGFAMQAQSSGVFTDDGYSAGTSDNVVSNCVDAPLGSTPLLRFPATEGYEYEVVEGMGDAGLCIEAGIPNPGCAHVEVIVPTTEVCTPGQVQMCEYTGPDGTEDVGACEVDKDYCVEDGQAWTGCVGEWTPQWESCETAYDDDCDGETTNLTAAPCPTELHLSYQQLKQFDFSWEPVPGAEFYQLLERVNLEADYVQIGGDTAATVMSLTVPLHLRINASYIVRTCNEFGCADSVPMDVTGSLDALVGYFKASNTEDGDEFASSVALSGDGATLAVGAPRESSNASGVNGDGENNSSVFSGAVYVFVRDDMTQMWVQQAYIKASTADSEDMFGSSVALSIDGDTLAIGAIQESSSATGINGNEADDSALVSGAAYVFVRDQMTQQWSQQAYIKASNTNSSDHFGESVALSGSGSTLAVGADEDSNATGVDGNDADNSMNASGAVYVFVRDEMAETWAQQAYIKASNTDAGDHFGESIALSADGATLAVGAWAEESNATGINGNQADNTFSYSGAAYVFVHDEMTQEWAQQAYIKASNTDSTDRFGESLSLSADGNILAVGAWTESSDAWGIDGNADDNSAPGSGAAYIYERNEMTQEWAQQAYVKASNTSANDWFGWAVALSGDGGTLAVAAYGEDSHATGIGGNETSDSVPEAGAVYLYIRDEMTQGWLHHAYVKASNTSADDQFGWRIALSGDGGTLAVGTQSEDSSASGIGGDQSDNSATNAGAVYLY